MDDHSVEVQKPLDLLFVQRSAYCSEPHRDIQEETFQYRNKLWEAFRVDFSQKPKRTKITSSNFENFSFDKLAERNEIFPEIVHKPIFYLENLIDVPQKVKDVPCKLKMRIDQRVLEGEANILDLTEGVFRG